MDDKDDDFGIDFKKIGSWFKRKGKTEQKSELKHEISHAEEEIKEVKQELKSSDISASGKTHILKEVKHEEKKIDAVKHELKENQLKKAESGIKKIGKDIEKIKEEKNEEDESIDFGKIKEIFKWKKEDKTFKKYSDDEISVNWKDILGFFSKYGIIFLILIPLCISAGIRWEAEGFHFTDDWAQSSVYNYYKNQISSQINSQYPNLPQTNKDILIDNQFKKVLDENKQTVKEQIKQTSNQFKSFFQDDNGNNYMPDIDPYYWYRYAKNVLEKGYYGDELRNGINYDNHMLAPLGREIAPTDKGHPYFLAYLYRIVSLFNPDITLFGAMALYPILISALSVIPAFFIGKRIAGKAGGFLSALMLAVVPAFTSRTPWGHADTDAWNVFLPLFICWFFLEAFYTKNLIKKISLAGAAGLLVGFYAIIWGGWWYIFDFIIASILGYIFYFLIFKKITELKDLGVIAGIFLFSSFIFVSLFNSSSVFFMGPLAPITFSYIKAPALESLWPNVLTTVAELNPGSISEIIGSVGGSLLYFISLLGLILIVFKAEEKFTSKDITLLIVSGIIFAILVSGFGQRLNLYFYIALLIVPIIISTIILLMNKKEIDIKMTVLLLIWFAGSIYASTKGIRFNLLLTPAFSIAFGSALGIFYYRIQGYAFKNLHVEKIISGAVMVVLFLFLFIGPIQSSMAIAKQNMPIINDVWYNSLDVIKANSTKNAVINSWWDFGHHFKALADRTVTFDGTTQATPQAHWIGKTLLTDDEDTAVGILRMLDCGGNTAFEWLYNQTKDTHKSVDILYEIILMDKNNAEEKLREEGIKEGIISEVLKNTHCSPPEDYFITSEDMIQKSGVWAHFGSWEFEKADIWLNVKKMNKDEGIKYMQNKFSYSEDKAEQIYYDISSLSSDGEGNNWISPWTSYSSGVDYCGKTANNSLQCGNGLKIDLENYNATLNSQKGAINPYSIVYIDNNNGKFTERIYPNSEVPYSVALIPRGTDYYNVLMQPPLAKSMFNRLFFFQGQGLKHFKLFYHESGLTGTDVYVWKIDWEGK